MYQNDVTKPVGELAARSHTMVFQRMAETELGLTWEAVREWTFAEFCSALADARRRVKVA